MSKFLLRNILLLGFLASCSPSSHNKGRIPNVNDAGSDFLPASSASLVDSTGFNQNDSASNTTPRSLMELPQTEDGEIVLSDGYYEADFKSYCLQPGTPSPSEGDAYRQAPLTGYRKEIIETVLRNSLKRPGLEQRNIQLLLWSVVSGSDFRRLSWEVQSTAQQLLSRKQIFELKGGVIGVVKTVSSALPETGASSKLRQLFEMGTSSYELFERIAVLQPSSEFKQASFTKDRWYKQQGGYYLRYFPSGYQHVKIQVFVPKGTVASEDSANYLLFDPVTVMAIPTHSNAQRLGIGAPVIEIVRKIIQIQNDPRTPRKPPVKNKNPKEVIAR